MVVQINTILKPITVELVLRDLAVLMARRMA